jgi:hypothetical protein
MPKRPLGHGEATDLELVPSVHWFRSMTGVLHVLFLKSRHSDGLLGQLSSV